MTKTELMETYTVEQLAEMIVEKERFIEMVREFNIFENIKTSGLFDDSVKGYYESKMSICESNVKVLEKKLVEKESRINHLQSEVEKYRKAFEGVKKERDCQIAEYQKKIEEWTAERDFLSKDSISVHQDPIDIAKDLIESEGEYEHNSLVKVISGNDKGTCRIFDVGELRQIAEHLLVYCNNQKENVNE